MVLNDKNLPRYLSGEVVVEVPFLVLHAQHVHDLAVLGHAGGALGLAVGVALEAVLVERVAAQEVHRGQLQRTAAHVTLGLLEDLSAVGRGTTRNVGFCTAYKTSWTFDLDRHHDPSVTWLWITAPFN